MRIKTTTTRSKTIFPLAKTKFLSGSACKERFNDTVCTHNLIRYLSIFINIFLSSLHVLYKDIIFFSFRNYNL